MLKAIKNSVDKIIYLKQDASTQDNNTKPMDLLRYFKSNISDNLQIQMPLGVQDVLRGELGSNFKNIVIRRDVYEDRGENAPIQKAIVNWTDHVFDGWPKSRQALCSKETLQNIAIQGLRTLTFLTVFDPNNQRDRDFQNKLFEFAMSQNRNSFSWEDVMKFSNTEFQDCGAIESIFECHLMGTFIHLSQRYTISKIEDEKVTFAVSRQFFHS